MIKIPKNISYNYAYCPIVFYEGIEARDNAYDRMKCEGIYCRKYWYPLIPKQQIFSSCKTSNLPNAEKLSQKILFLPIYPGLEKKVVRKIIKIINDI